MLGNVHLSYPRTSECKYSSMNLMRTVQPIRFCSQHPKVQRPARLKGNKIIIHHQELLSPPDPAASQTHLCKPIWDLAPPPRLGKANLR